MFNCFDKGRNHKILKWMPTSKSSEVKKYKSKKTRLRDKRENK